MADVHQYVYSENVQNLLMAQQCIRSAGAFYIVIYGRPQTQTPKSKSSFCSLLFYTVFYSKGSYLTKVKLSAEKGFFLILFSQLKASNTLQTYL